MWPIDTKHYKLSIKYNAFNSLRPRYQHHMRYYMLCFPKGRTGKPSTFAREIQ